MKTQTVDKPDASPAIGKEQAQLQVIPKDDLSFGISLGTGSYCEAFLGKWLEQDVAIKKLHPILKEAGGAAFEAAFIDEAITMAKLRYPNIVTLYGVVDAPDFCIVMEFMPGGALYGLLHSEEPLGWELRYQIGLDTACGLWYLHKYDVLHRDLKSPNILLDENRRAKISDYGTSKRGAMYTTSKDSLYSPPWMAPELLMQNDQIIYKKSCDVYSFAMVLWELATRRQPYESWNAWPFHVKGGRREIIPQDTPEPMKLLIERCWSQQPEDRPEMGIVVKEIKQARNGVPLLSTPDSNINANIALAENIHMFHARPLTATPATVSPVSSSSSAFFQAGSSRTVVSSVSSASTSPELSHEDLMKRMQEVLRVDRNAVYVGTAVEQSLVGLAGIRTLQTGASFRRENSLECFKLRFANVAEHQSFLQYYREHFPGCITETGDYREGQLSVVKVDVRILTDLVLPRMAPSVRLGQQA